jgi:hypothetical protein
MQALMDLLLTVIAWRPEHLEITVRTSLITATALMVSAFIQNNLSGQNGGLSLFDAIIIGQLITIKIAGILRYPQGLVTNITFAVFVTMSVTYQLWVWVHVDSFGSQPQCNDSTIFVFFGHSVRATASWLRTLTIIAASFAAVAALNAVMSTIVLLGLRIPSMCERNKHEDWHASPINFGQLATIIYLLVTTEQIVARNHIPDADNQWTYGQTLSVFLVIPSFVEILTRLHEIMAGAHGED